MKTLLLSIILCIISTKFFGQENHKMSLSECINYALERSEKIKQAKYQKQINEIQYNESKMNFLPDLNLSTSQIFSFGRGLLEDNTYGNETLSNTSFGLSSTINIFDGLSNFYTKKREKLNCLSAEQSILKEKDNLTLRIITSYLQVLLNKELYKVATEQFSFSSVQIVHTQNMVESGKLSTAELMEVESQVANDKLSLIQSKNNLQLSIFNLSQEIEYSNYEEFDIIESDLLKIINKDFVLTISPEQIYENAFNNMAIIKERKLLLQAYEKDIKIARSTYLPTVSLNLQYNNNYYYNFHPMEFEKKISFGDQIRNNSGELISISFSFPLFDRNKTRNAVKRAKANLNIKQSEMVEIDKELKRDIQEAHLNAILSKEKYFASKFAVKTSEKHFNQVKDKYELGKTNFYDYNEAKNKLIKAMLELSQTKYDYAFRIIILDFYNYSGKNIYSNYDF